MDRSPLASSHPPASPAPSGRFDSERGTPRLSGQVGGRYRSYLLRRGSSSVGADLGNDLVVPAEGVSRRHLRLHCVRSEVEVEDLGSKNGTFVNGRSVERARIFVGDRIALGNVELVLDEIPAGDDIIAIPVGTPPAPPHEETARDSVASTRNLPGAGIDVARRWMAALERAAEEAARCRERPGRPDLGPSLEAAVDELGAEAGCILASVRGSVRVLAAVGSSIRTGRLARLTEAMESASAGSSEARFMTREAPEREALWVEARGDGAWGLIIAGDFPGREQSEQLLRALARLLGPPGRGENRLETPQRGPARASVVLRFPPDYVVGRSPVMRLLYRQLTRVAGLGDPLLIVGETGVGKEPLGQAVHLSSPRRDGPLIAVNCAAIPADLLEAELFGVARGAATGVAERPGHFLAAGGGTLVLDEIGELPATVQAKLLRAIDNREIPRLGGGVASSDARIVAMTNRDLRAEVARGAFRDDLYYRVAAHELRVPPLRERTDDIPVLAEHFLARIARAQGCDLAGITVAALEVLLAYPWPGNVRELQNEIRRLVAASPEGGAIESGRLSSTIRRAMGATGASGASDAAERTLPERIAVLERQAIEHALIESGGNRTRAAELLGIHRNSLAAKIERLGIDPTCLAVDTSSSS